MMLSENKGTVLYVEDNIDNRTLVRRILLSEDYNLIEAVNAAECLKVLENTKPDLILMDINMPDMDGYTLTANVMRGDKEKTLEAGCDGYIQKPLDIDQLLKEIERFLARSA